MSCHLTHLSVDNDGCDRDRAEGLVQDCSNSSAVAMELLQSCTKPSIWCGQVIFSKILTIDIHAQLVRVAIYEGALCEFNVRHQFDVSVIYVNTYCHILFKTYYYNVCVCHFRSRQMPIISRIVYLIQYVWIYKAWCSCKIINRWIIYSYNQSLTPHHLYS